MTDRDLGRALLELDASTLSGQDDTAARTAAILQQDRFRLKLLTWSTVAIWLVALAMIFGDLVYFALLFPRQALLHQHIDAGDLPADQIVEIERALLVEFHMGTLLIAFSVFIATLAAFLTVLLIFASRRATLRQVNANLTQICGQLRQMRSAAQPAAR
jgi:ABC-type uncharacterized transport system permease subunit